jgi:halimadienyl-diphosphate synthase
MDRRQTYLEPLDGLGPGKLANTAYDTAWVARLGDIDRDLSGQALDWICRHQLPDGSWGAPEVNYYHDRVICTLAAVTALAQPEFRERFRSRIERGRQALAKIVLDALPQANADAYGATVGFEMIVPTLVAEAERLDINQYLGEGILERSARMRDSKMAKLRGRRINRFISTAFSAEMAGADGRDSLDVDNLQEANGSVALSPSATAYFAIQVRPGDAAALDYLRAVVSRQGAPPFAPFDIYERVWVLWNMAVAGEPDAETKDWCRPHLDYLEAAWEPGTGVGFSIDYTPKDADNTFLGYDLLRRAGRNADLSAVLSHEDEHCFRCYPHESHPSTGVNIHALSALRQAGFDLQHPAVRKTVRFLQATRLADAYWLDKWHISPYYPAAHAVIAAAGFVDDLVERTIEWILATQTRDGGWGANGTTAEETAYCLQALIAWKRSGRPVPMHRLRDGRNWLMEHGNLPRPALWIGKCLYFPQLIVESAIQSALLMWEREFAS